MLVRQEYDQDVTRAHTEYALTEIADECHLALSRQPGSTPSKLLGPTSSAAGAGGRR